ncbi:hypothetical protein [Aquisalimonas sp.]|uniref:hypothetical protein n=1 Tax=Aquisalimonas sp. TaxID=1872621 RepID=UPI0025C08088|nr:hypothetical protein [Aquisalimonas sp.]
MLVTALLVTGTVVFVLLAFAMYGRRGPVRATLAATAIIVLIGLVWVAMAFLPP